MAYRTCVLCRTSQLRPVTCSPAHGDVPGGLGWHRRRVRRIAARAPTCCFIPPLVCGDVCSCWHDRSRLGSEEVEGVGLCPLRQEPPFPLPVTVAVELDGNTMLPIQHLCYRCQRRLGVLVYERKKWQWLGPEPAWQRLFWPARRGGMQLPMPPVRLQEVSRGDTHHCTWEGRNLLRYLVEHPKLCSSPGTRVTWPLRL